MNNNRLSSFRRNNSPAKTRPGRITRGHLERLESRELLSGNTATNPVNPLDVNNDGIVTPLDGLLVTNQINATGTGQVAKAGPPYLDTNADGIVSPIDSLLVCNFLNGSRAATPSSTNLMDVTLKVVDAQGNPLTSTPVGSTFYLSAYVQDVSGRGSSGGVFAAYTDVTYSPSLASVSPSAAIVFGPNYPNGHQASLGTPGLVVAGAFDDIMPLGDSQRLLWTLPVQATAAGVETFAVGPDSAIGDENLEYGFDTPIPPDQIHYTPATIQITAVTKPASIVLLDPTGRDALNVSGNGLISVGGAGGSIIVDSNNREAAIVNGSSLVRAANIDVSGGLKTKLSGQFVGTIQVQAPTPDPIGLPLPAVPANTFPAATITGTSTVALQPGTYLGGISISGRAIVTLAPGIYYLQGGGLSVSNQAVLKGAGVLIVNAPQSSTDTVRIGNQSRVQLIAPNSLPAPYQAYQGIGLMQDPASAAPITVSGQGRLDVSGTIYAPSARLTVRDSAIVNQPGALPAAASGQLILADLTVTTNGNVILQSVVSTTTAASIAIADSTLRAAASPATVSTSIVVAAASPAQSSSTANTLAPTSQIVPRSTSARVPPGKLSTASVDSVFAKMQ